MSTCRVSITRVLGESPVSLAIQKPASLCLGMLALKQGTSQAIALRFWFRDLSSHPLPSRKHDGEDTEQNSADDEQREPNGPLCNDHRQQNEARKDAEQDARE